MSKRRAVLLVDVGNSSTIFAPYESGKIGRILKIPTAELTENIGRMKLSRFARVVVSSVVPHLDYLFRVHSGAVFASAKNVALSVRLPKPEQVGADRLVDALAAWRIYGRDCLVVDSGTAITFCVVTKDGGYEGGAIFPGMHIASRALNDYTAKVPLIYVSKREELIGKTTKEAVQAGLYFGYIAMINGMIAAYKKERPGLFVVGAGNGLEILEDRLAIDVYDPSLTMKGLAFVAEDTVQELQKVTK